MYQKESQRQGLNLLNARTFCLQLARSKDMRVPHFLGALPYFLIQLGQITSWMNLNPINNGVLGPNSSPSLILHKRFTAVPQGHTRVAHRSVIATAAAASRRAATAAVRWCAAIAETCSMGVVVVMCSVRARCSKQPDHQTPCNPSPCTRNSDSDLIEVH